MPRAVLILPKSDIRKKMLRLQLKTLKEIAKWGRELSTSEGKLINKETVKK
jgi:hypothetical protein